MMNKPDEQPGAAPAAASLLTDPARLNISERVAILLGSGLVHLVLLLVCSQVAMLSTASHRQQTVVIELRDDVPQVRPSLADKLREMIPEEPVPVEPERVVKKPVVRPPVPEKKQTDQKPPGDLKTDVPLVVSVRKPVLGTGAGSGSPLGPRTSSDYHKQAIRKYHGTEESENAVKASVAWLMRHQSSDGRWSCRSFTQQCEPGEQSCGGTGTVADIDPGLTALTLLAFLSGGNFPGDGREFGYCVGRGIEYLISIQHPSGRIGPPCGHELYNHSVGTLALTESWMLSKDDSLKEPVEKAVKYLISTQQEHGGWDYTPARTGRNDTSITGFAVMALKSAQTAGIEIPWMTTWGLLEHLDRMTRDSGEIVYADQGVGAGRMGEGMVAVGAVSRQFLGWPLQSPVLVRQYNILLQNLPRWEKLSENSFHTTYYWYYGTLAMFECGGEKWETWNASLRDMLVKRQRRDGCARGSWDPDGKWLGKAASRIYSTAMNAMNLQIYYRYLPLYERASTLNSMEALMRASMAQGEMRIRALRLLSEFQNKLSHEQLVKALDDPDDYVRLNAARSLLEQDDDASAQPVLVELSRSPNGFVRSGAVEALVRLDSIEIVPVLIERLADGQDFIVARAAEKLQRLCRATFPFDLAAGPAERAKAIAAWTDWWMQYRAGEITIDTSIVMAKVTSVNDMEVMLDVGSRDSVRVYDDFDIIRGGRVIARATIHKVGKTLSAARIKPLDDPDADKPDVREGDAAKRRRK
ncbi:MAG TPA: HEAT repeat domain-containing protein [Planctomycetota bacterium]|nr:HEAT repeat domain-containing protein [Planctomycetota bacterium]